MKLEHNKRIIRFERRDRSMFEPNFLPNEIPSQDAVRLAFNIVEASCETEELAIENPFEIPRASLHNLVLRQRALAVSIVENNPSVQETIDNWTSIWNPDRLK